MDASHVNGDRFFTENVFASVNSGAHVLWAEAWRGGEDDEVNAGVDHFLEGVDAGELAVGGDFGAVAELFRIVECSFVRVLKGVTDGPEDGVFVGSEGLRDGAGAATTAADETDLDGVVIPALGTDNVRESHEGSGSEGCASLDDLATIGGVNFVTHDS